MSSSDGPELKRVGVRASDQERAETGWSEKASKAIIPDTQIIRSRPAGDPRGRAFEASPPWVSTKTLSEKELCVCKEQRSAWQEVE